jgi:hypothetical protein
VILLDTSVGVDHLRAGDATVAALPEVGRVLSRPHVIGELALGRMRRRREVIEALGDLPAATPAAYAEVLVFIERQGLAGLEIGYGGAQLLAATRLTAGAAVWTRHRRLAAAAGGLGLDWRHATE